jgi:stearoyl-CoA desaturase (delta-9 desaturase)
MIAITADNNFLKRFWLWLSNHDATYAHLQAADLENIDYARLGIFIIFHLGIFGILFTGVSTTAIVFATSMYFLRMFFITGFYHRYFSHKSFRTSRPFQFLMAVAGCTAGQRGPLWWASHHRYHHLKSDSDKDPHTPDKGFMNSHVLWIFKKENFNINHKHIRDLKKYPELVLLERFHWVPFLLFGYFCFLAGELLNRHSPLAGTDGTQLLIWGFFISTICLYHGTFTINSLAHKYGSRRFETRDNSKNNLFLALITLGEGWHNNHHRYPVATRQGFYWWEIDMTYMGLKFLSYFGFVSDLKPVPVNILAEGQGKKP